MNYYDGRIRIDTFFVQAFGDPCLFFCRGYELKWIAFRRIWLLEWRVTQRLQRGTDEAQVGNRSRFRGMEWQSSGKKWPAGFNSETQAVWDTCQVEQSRSPPEIRAEVDGEVVPVTT